MEKQFKPVPNIERICYHGTPMKPDIKIFVSHRIDLDSKTVDDPIYIPVRCGAMYDDRDGLTMLGDDTGENISEQRESLCELTVQYWAWKNVEADYYGLFHYRRYLSFSHDRHSPDAYGNVLEQFIDEETVQRYGLAGSAVEKLISDYDLILPEAQDVSKYPEQFASIWEQYTTAPHLHEADLHLVLDIIAEKYPEYTQTAQEYLKGQKAYMCNLYIMKRELFFQYSQWLFDILAAFRERSNMAGYSQEEMRTPGHLGERLLGIFVNYQRAYNPKLAIKELQPVAFLGAGKESAGFGLPSNLTIHPAFQNHNVPVVLATSNMFAPFAASVIQSVIDCASPEYYYDIICIEQELTAENKRKLKSLQRGSNVSVRIFHIRFADFLQKGEVNAYISSETYFRLFFPYLLTKYKKILWLDSDTLVRRDVAELFNTELGDLLIGATRDYKATALLKGADPEYKIFCQTELGISDPYRYFQAGVLLLNLEMLRQTISFGEMRTQVQEAQYPFGDQDILNKLCAGRVYWLDNRWDVVADVDDYVSNFLRYWDPGKTYMDYQVAKRDPYIIHFAGPTKPWHSPQNTMADFFWTACRKTPFYEVAFADMIHNINHGIERYGAQQQPQPQQNVEPGKSFIDQLKRFIKNHVSESSRTYRLLKRIYHAIKRG